MVQDFWVQNLNNRRKNLNNMWIVFLMEFIAVVIVSVIWVLIIDNENKTK